MKEPENQTSDVKKKKQQKTYPPPKKNNNIKHPHHQPHSEKKI